MRALAEPEERIAGRDRVSMLLELYGALLTERQREMLSWYYELDLSLSEIAAQAGVSRQAVHDLLRRAVVALEAYEGRLHLALRAAARQERILALLRELETAMATEGERQRGALCRAQDIAGRVLD